MHIVFLNQYYPPDAAPTGVMLADLADAMVRNGHEVTVICAGGGYALGRDKTSRRKTQEGEEDDEEVESLKVEGRRSGEEESIGSAQAAPNQQSTINHQPSTSSSSQPSTLNSQLSTSSSSSQPSTLNHYQGTGGRGQGSETEIAQSSSFHQPSTINYQLLLNSQPSTSPTILRISATRFGRGSFVGKVFDYASYYVGVAWKLMTMEPRPERIVALTTPPYLSVVARVVSKIRGGDHAHWVMDLYPDVMVAHGMLRERGVAHRVLAGIARWGWGGKRCAAVVALGPDMAERMEALLLKGEEARASNIERRTLNFELRKEEEGENIEHRTLNFELRKEEGRRKTARRKTQDEEEEEEEEARASNIEHRTLNIEHPPSPIGYGATSRKEEGEAFHIQHSKFNIQNSSFNMISWVPLWGAEGERSGDGFLENEGHGQDARATVEDMRGQRGWGAGDLVVMYSGNMGLGHCFGEILAAARSLGESAGSVAGGELSPEATGRTRFVFFGAGKRRDEIAGFMDAHPQCAVELHGYAPADILDAHLRSADVHVVSLKPEWTGTMVPSKLQGVFRLGRPVIFIGSATSSIGRWVIESGGGWVVEPGDEAGMLQALDEARNPDVRMRRGHAARDFARIHFDKEINLGKLAGLFESIT